MILPETFHSPIYNDVIRTVQARLRYTTGRRARVACSIPAHLDRV